MSTPFVKMHGAGNDFIMLDGISADLPADLQRFSREVCHRRFGIGADQVLVAKSSQIADFKMEIYNADGGEVEMCGNGIRSFVQFVHDLGLTTKEELTIETLAGIIRPRLVTEDKKSGDHAVWVQVDMGLPELEGSKIPVACEGRVINHRFGVASTQGLLPSDPKSFDITCVSMGNPHCVIFVDDVESFPVHRIGPVIENDPFFPNRVNVEFVQLVDRSHVVQRTWERGSGETYACGTGASAVCVAAVLNGLTENHIQVALKGGDLDLSWQGEGHPVLKTGPSARVFKGEWL